MAYSLIWSPASRDDLRDIVRFISRDSRSRAETFGYRIITRTDKLQPGHLRTSTSEIAQTIIETAIVA